jgi:cation diffusion facilitator CzcD-associated flavoprotein CzcO
MGEYQPVPEFHFQDRAVDDGRKVRVIIIGAGVSGIGTYIRLLQHVPNAQVTIVDKNPCVGGTWFENRYPGVACGESHLCIIVKSGDG